MDTLVNQVTLSEEDKQLFSENGFIQLKQFLTNEAIHGLRDLTSNSRQVKKPPKFASGDFSKIGFDVDNAITHKIYSSTNFQYTLKQLIPRRLIFTQGVGFELTPQKKGLIWHTDIVSFSDIMPDDLAYSLWIPLDSINTKEQHGGIAHVPLKVYYGNNYFSLFYQLAKHQKVNEASQLEEFKKSIFFASEIENLVLESNKVEFDFEVGDVVLLDKFVWHRSCPLKEGALPSRMAYAMRFVDCEACYSKVFIDGVHSMLKTVGDDTYTSFGYTLANLKEGDLISDSLISGT